MVCIFGNRNSNIICKKYFSIDGESCTPEHMKMVCNGEFQTCTDYRNAVDHINSGHSETTRRYNIEQKLQKQFDQLIKGEKSPD